MKHYTDKDLLHLYSELNTLRDTRYTYTPIEPYHNGYFKVPVLKPHIIMTEPLDSLLTLMTHYKHRIWSRDKTFLKRVSKKRKVERRLEPFTIMPYQYDTLSEDLQAYFIMNVKEVFGYSIWYRLDRYTTYFDEKIIKCWVTEQRVINPTTESRMTELQDTLFTDRDNYRRLKTLKGWTNSPYDREWCRRVYRKTERAMHHEALKEIHELFPINA